MTKTINKGLALETERMLFNLFTVANLIMSTQLIKPILCISLTRRRSTTEKQTSLFVLKGINFQPLLPAFT